MYHSFRSDDEGNIQTATQLLKAASEIKLILKSSRNKLGKISKSNWSVLNNTVPGSNDILSASISSTANGNGVDSRLKIHDPSSPRNSVNGFSESQLSPSSRCSACRVKKLIASPPTEVPVNTMVGADVSSPIKQHSAYSQTDLLDVSAPERESAPERDRASHEERAEMQREDMRQRLLSVIQDQAARLSELAVALQDAMASLRAEREMRPSSSSSLLPSTVVDGRKEEEEEMARKKKVEDEAAQALEIERSAYLEFKERVAQETFQYREEVARLQGQLEDLRLSHSHPHPHRLAEQRQKEQQRSEGEEQQQQQQQGPAIVDSEEARLLRAQSQRDGDAAALSEVRRQLGALTAAADAALLRERDWQAERSQLLALAHRRDEQLRGLKYETSCLQRRLAQRHGHAEGGSREQVRVAELEQMLADVQVREYRCQLEIANLKLQLVGKSHSMFS